MLYYMRPGWPSRTGGAAGMGSSPPDKLRFTGSPGSVPLGGSQSRRANSDLGACRGRGATPEMERRARIVPFPDTASSSTRREVGGTVVVG